MKKQLLLLLPVPFMSLLYLNMPELVQILSTNSALQVMITGIAPSEAAGGQTGAVQAAQGEISMDAFPKRKTDKDDTERIQRAVDYCIANDQDLVFPSGSSYTVRQVNIEAGLRIVGYGATVTLADDQPKATRMFTTQNRKWESAEDSDYLIIEGLTLDGNCWNQGEFMDYEKEQQFGIFFAGSLEKKGMLRGKVINCRFQNWCADGVHIYTNADVAVIGCSSINCFRGGIVASGSPSNIRITDFVGEKGTFGNAMDIEIDTPGKVSLTIDAMQAYCDIDIYMPEGSVATVSSLTVVGGFTKIYGFKNEITVSDSDIGQLDVINATDCVFNDTTLNVMPSKTEDVIGATVRVMDGYDKLSQEDFYTVFNDCTFERSDKDEPLETDKGFIALKGYFGKITLNDCTFGEGLKTGYYALGVAYSTLKNVTFDCDTAVAMKPLVSARIYEMVLDGVRYGENTDVPFRFLDYLEKKPYTTVVLKNMILDSKQAGYAGDQAIGTTKIESSRTILVESDPNVAGVAGFAGDTAVLKTPVDGEVHEWVATTTDPVAAEWEVAKGE
nr:right-handed parallel beta-helix repeat-containing protein [uncultured Trichococcus sp.]